MSELDELLKEELQEEFAEESAQHEPEQSEQETAGEKEGSTPEPGQEESEQQSEEFEQTDYAKQAEGLKSAIAAERQKRQQLEQELEAFRNAQEKPDFWDNPEAVLQQMEQRTQQEIQKARIDWSENAARGRYEDFEDKMEVFSQMVSEGVANWQQVVNAADPAEHMYQVASKYQQLNEFGSADSYKESIEAEIRKRVEAEMEEKMQKLLSERENLPGSVTEARAAGTGKGQESDALDEILGR